MPAHDVLIIGAGLAGQRAALAAAQAGASVAIMSKVHPVRSHSVAAAGGINAAISVDDDWHSHAYDTVKGSDFLGDQDAIEVMCSEAPGEVMHLEHIGVTFHRNDKGEMDLRAFGGASMKRTAYVADITGQAILHVLYEQLMKHHETVERYEEWFTTSLLQDEAGRCCGVIARDVRSGRMEAFTAKNVILACGGAGQVYKPDDQRADRDRRRHRAWPTASGAPLMDMEMVQYHPTSLVETGILITEGARGEGAHLLNSERRALHGEVRRPTRWSWPRATSSRAPSRSRSTRAAASGPTARASTSTSPSVPRKRTLEALREIVNLGKDFAGVDITREPIMIRPGQHYIMGGVKTDVDGRDADRGPLRGRRGRVRVGARRQPPRRQLAARHADLRPPRGRARRRARGAHGDARARHARAAARGRGRRSTRSSRARATGRRVSEIKNELGETMNQHVAVFRDEAGPAERARDDRRA